MTLTPQQIVENKKRDYQQAFGSPAGQRVLMDLQAYCRATEGPYTRGDRDETMMRCGCLEVWNHIARHIHLSTQQLYAIYVGHNVKIGETDG